MKSIYFAWSFKPAEDMPNAPFEYLLHPHPGDGGIRYCNAILECADVKSGWNTILASFPGAVRNLGERADGYYQKVYATTKTLCGVRTIRPKALAK
ncbi:MAG: hypothetical protein M5U26_01480 [Planctomycetota bacterium]|nr:hypothetical protein [Planctomycetota bacterium]